MTTYVSAASTALVTLDTAFDGGIGEAAIKPVLKENPRLQWFNGLSTTTMEVAVGWHIEAEVNPLLDEVAARLGVKRYIVQHKTPGKNGEAKHVPFWALSFGQRPVSLFVLSLGLQSKWQMNKTDERLGLAYGWEVVRTAQGVVEFKPNSTEPKRQCKLQFRVFVQELYEAGFHEWLQVGLAGYITDDMLGALNEQFRTLAAYAAQTEAKGSRRNAPFYGFALPLVAGPMKYVGPEKGEKSSIYPMQAQIPQPVSAQFLMDHMISKDLLTRIREGLMDETLVWSIERSVTINHGEEQGEDALVVDGGVIEAATSSRGVPHPGSTGEGERLVNPGEKSWIVSGYCMGKAPFIRMVCDRFGVTAPEQLQKSHYDTLYGEATMPQ